MSLRLSTLDAQLSQFQLEPLTESLEMAHPTHYVCYNSLYVHDHHVNPLLLVLQSGLPRCLPIGRLHLWRQYFVHLLWLSNVDALVHFYLHSTIQILHGCPYGNIWTLFYRILLRHAHLNACHLVNLLE